MTLEQILPYISTAAAFLAWLRGETKVNTLSEIHDENIKNLTTKTNMISESIATSKNENKNMRLELGRLEDLKANRETVDSFRSDLNNLRHDLDKRFDKLETILEKLRSE